MKLVFKFIQLLFIGLFIAIFVYPFLHETGHFISSLLLHVRVLDFKIVPVPSVLCEFDGSINSIEFLIIGLSGAILPYIVTLLLPMRTFWLWYCKITIKVICLISFVVSITSIFLYQKGNSLSNDDITNILQHTPQYSLPCFVLFILLFFIGAVTMIKDYKFFSEKKLYI